MQNSVKNSDEEIIRSEYDALNSIAATVSIVTYNYILSKLPFRQIRDVNVKVQILDINKRLFEIEVNVETGPFVKEEYLKELTDKAIEFGFKVLDQLIKLLDEGKLFGKTFSEIERIARKIAKNISNES